MTSTSSPSIAIVGGGIAGVTLAIGLLKRGVNVKIYEQAHSLSEIGAGVAFGPNAARAMSELHGTVKAAFDKVSTGNLSPEKARTWFDFVDGFNNKTETSEDWVFDLQIPEGSGNAYRANYLSELVQHIPPETALFGKHLDTIVEHDDTLELKFHDGTTAKHDAVIGCDGIKSRVRAYLVGEDSPKAWPTYTHKYAYRGLIPMEKALEHLGQDIAGNGHMHLGPGGHILTFPVKHGEVLNVVAFHQDDSDWTDSRLTSHAHKTDVERDYAGWHPTVAKLIELLNDDLDRWAIFDLAENPLDAFNRGRICLVGDAAHATSPHHGAGAGFCVEDSAVLCELVTRAIETSNKGRVSVGKSMEAAFAAYDLARRERTQWLVQSSRHQGDIFDWMDPDAGSDSAKILADIKPRCEYVWNWDLKKNISEALADFEARVA